MVAIARLLGHPLLVGVIVAAEANESPLKRLEPEQRTKVMMAMVSLLAICLVLMLVAWLFARAARHYTRHTVSSFTNPRNIVPDDWANKPLSELDDESQNTDQPNQ